MLNVRVRWSVGSVLGCLLLSLGLTGCDYWPPALQAQIEQLKMDVQNAAVEKAQLQNQLIAANRTREEVQVRLDDLSRVNNERAAQVRNLEHSLAAEREKVVKLSRGGSTKVAAKPSAKPAPKASPKKSSKPTAKRTGSATPLLLGFRIA